MTTQQVSGWPAQLREIVQWMQKNRLVLHVFGLPV